MRYLSFGITLVLSLAGFSHGSPVKTECSQYHRLTNWVNRPWGSDALECEAEIFKADRVVVAMNSTSKLWANHLVEYWGNRAYPFTLETAEIRNWIDWTKRGNEETKICGDSDAQVVLYPISNANIQEGLAGPYRVAMSRKYRQEKDKNGNVVRVYAFCGLAVRGIDGYKMCNNYQRRNSLHWELSGEEDPVEFGELMSE